MTRVTGLVLLARVRYAAAVTSENQAVSALRELLASSQVDLAKVGALFDGLSAGERVQAALALGGREQRSLWNAAQGVHAIGAEQLVPAASAVLREVRHFGRNTMPAFQRFEKRFYRDAQGELFGANFQLWSPVTGPGYFKVVAQPERREIMLDGAAASLPQSTPPGWPAVTPNERGFSRFVYGFLTDHLRKVSEHVTIGMPARHGKPLGSYFILCRES
jgi:hypothetical protein